MKRWQKLYPNGEYINHVRLILVRLYGWRSGRRVLLLLFGVGFCWFWGNQALLAATDPGADPARPLFPTGAWQTLPAGASHWYAFRDEGDGAPIVVRLTVIPEGRATFAVITPSALQQWRLGEPLVPVGEGSPLAILPGERYWTGSFVQSGTYYVLVQSHGAGSSSYRLTIDGRDVSFPILSFTQSAITSPQTTNHYPLRNTDPAPLPSTTTAEQTATPSLSSAEKPLPPVGKPMTITVGETHWYAFRDEGDAAMIQVRADAIPAQCLTFQVWTPEQFTRWQQGEEVKPVGQGTANPTLKADLFWTGSFVKSGIYYVVVKHNPAATGPCTYKLLVLGDDVSLVMPTTP
ncbi:MAG: hypothetical protein DYG89_42855 [Caldilinea sp. CFX5]|nr:hypothetical protein [Caldilinea sp. CFX5]